MAVTLESSNTTTATGGGSEDVLDDVNSVGTFTFHIDTVNMVAGDVLEVRIYQMVLTGGTRRVAYYQRYDGAQHVDDRIKISVPISNDLTDSGALRFAITQSGANSDKAFPWKVLKYA